ncbi:MAG: nucleoside hydrolase [Thermoguttaceae bacterium]|nr:nucleoside hydrolase [Thermoguttaceae bacterium]
MPAVSFRISILSAFSPKMTQGLFFAFFAFFLSTSVFSEDWLDVRDTPNDVVPVIFDTDIGGDIDDAFALGILHQMQARGKCKLLAVTVSRCRGNSGDYVRAFNTNFGSPDIPIATNLTNPINERGHYSDQTLALKNEDGSPRYPVPAYTLHEPTYLLRKVLANAKDHSVVLIQVGEATNTAAFLDSPPDELSPLTGRELAARKVRLLSVMGGAFGTQDLRWNEHREHNFIMDLPAAKKLVAEWPGKIVFSGYETGDAIRLSVCGLQNDLLQPSPNLLWDSYCEWCKACGMKRPDHPRPSWDLTSCFFVLRPEKEREYYSLTPPGTVTVLEDGRTRFTPSENGKHRVFITTPEQNIRVQEAFVNLIGERH